MGSTPLKSVRYIKTEPRGFSLIEALITVAVIAATLVTGLKYYQEYSSRAYRGEAITYLTRAANEIDACGAEQGGVYTNCALPTGQNIRGVTLPDLTATPNNTYQLSFSGTDGADPPNLLGNGVAAAGYIIVATRTVAESNDVSCLTGDGNNYELVIDHLGRIGIRDGGNLEFGTIQARTCWNR